MYEIDRATNSIHPLVQKTFSELKIGERENLQEWIAKRPDVLGEDLLIIQKEFSGFDKTRERPDLLALDKEGALVVIENKLDDSGKDVTWQALKYASYCFRLSKSDIAEIYQEYLSAEPDVNAEERISEFMDEDFEVLRLNRAQRIILIAAEFRPEVTSTVLWLKRFGVHLQCFRATPFVMEDKRFLKIDQILQDAEDYMIGIAKKAEDDIESNARLEIYFEFWSKLLAKMNSRETDLFQNITPKLHGRIEATAGGTVFSFSVSKSNCRVFLNIRSVKKSKDEGVDQKEANEAVFDQLEESKEQIESAFGGSLDWDRKKENVECHIGVESEGNVSDRDQWEKMIDFMTDAMFRLEQAIKEPLKQAVDWSYPA